MPVSTDLRNFLRSYRTVPTLSVYLGGGLADPAGQRAWRVELRHALSVARAQLNTLTSRERQPFETCVSRIEQQLPDPHALHRAGGWFCVCAVDGTMVDLTLNERVSTDAQWRIGPVILPYVTSQQDEPVFVLHLGRDTARVDRLLGTQLHEIDRYESTFTQGPGYHMGSAPRPGFHQGTIGETLTDRAQRRQRDARQHLATQAHHRVTTLLEGQGLLVICGPSEVTHHFVTGLLPAIAQRTVCTTELPPEASEAGRAHHVREALDTLRSNRQLAWFMALRERVYIDRHAALGLQSVRTAIAMGAADHVILTEEFSRMFPVEAERLVQDAVLHGASASIIAENVAALVNRDAQGIAAELRYAIPIVTPPSLAAQPLAASMPSSGASL